MDEIQNNNNEKTEEASSPQELPEPPIPEPNLEFVESPLPLKTTEKIEEDIPPITPIIIKALEKAINHSSNLLFKPFRLSIWLRLMGVIFLIVLFSLINFSTSVNLYATLPIDVRDQIRYEFESLFLGGLIIKLFLALIFFIGLCLLIFAGIICFAFRFVFIELITGRKKEIAESFIGNFKNGIRAYLWSIFVFILQVIYLSFFAIIFTIKMKSDISKLNLDFITMLSNLSSFIFYIFLITLPFICLNSVFNNFIMPIMIFNNVGVLRGWGKFFKLLIKNIFRFIAYFIFFFILMIIFILGIGITIAILFTLLAFIFTILSAISIIVAIFSISILSILLLILTILFLMPIITFLRLLPIAFMGQLDETYRFS